jgi:hypothetical protein
MSGKPIGYWEFFAANVHISGDAPLYARFAEGVAGNGEIQALARNARPGQPLANILFAAVHFLLLRGADDPLRRHYPNLNGGARVEGEDPFPHFAAFCGKHRDALLPLIRSRVTNTNEVGRSAVLHAGFREAAREGGEPLHLIEIGPSAGLNMIWDRYRVRYRRGAETFETEIPDAPLTLDCELRGDKTPPLGPPPRIASRVGLELNPVDLSNADDRDWLRALVWPDQTGRFAKLEAALEIYKDARPEIRVGDALALLPDALARVPADEPVCVYHTFVTYQFSEEMRRAFYDLLTIAGLRRKVWCLSNEGRFDNNTNPLVLWRYHDGAQEERLLAHTQPHGAWIEWMA